MCCACAVSILSFLFDEKEERLSQSQEHVSVSLQEEASVKVTWKLQQFSSCTTCDHIWTCNRRCAALSIFTPHHFENKHHCTGMLTWTRQVLRTASSPRQDCITPVYLVTVHCDRESFLPNSLLLSVHMCSFNWMFPLCGIWWMSADICKWKKCDSTFQESFKVNGFLWIFKLGDYSVVETVSV